jgi:hypothetical protein
VSKVTLKVITLKNKMSDIPTPSAGVGSFVFGFIAIFAVLYSMWYFTGGPQKESSNKAFIDQPTYTNPYSNAKPYGTINAVDKVNREINP